MLAFSRIENVIDEAVLTSIENVRIAGNELDLTAVGIKGPSSTWTYLVNDDPFRKQIGSLLTGPGGATIAIYSAVVLMPLLVLWGLVDRFFKKLSRRRSDFLGPH
jgi:preprotein translocase subunit SecA